MFHIVLGCFSWVFFYFSLKSHFRDPTDLDDYEFYADEKEGTVVYTHRRNPMRWTDERSDEHSDESDEEDSEEERSETTTTPKDEKTLSVSAGEEDMDDYVLTSDPEEEEKQDEPQEEEKQVEDEPQEEVEEQKEEVEQVEEEESQNLLETWTCTRSAGFDVFMKEIHANLSEEDRRDVDNAINRVHEIMNPNHWTDNVKTVAVCRSFSMKNYSERVRSRIMAPAIWQEYTTGHREICEYLFARAIYRWVAEE